MTDGQPLSGDDQDGGPGMSRFYYPIAQKFQKLPVFDQ